MRLTYMREVRKKGQMRQRRERRERERNNNGRSYGRQFILRGDPDVGQFSVNYNRKEKEVVLQRSWN